MIKTLVLAALLVTQTSSVPALNELQKAQIEVLVLRMEVAQYRLMQAERDRDIAMTMLQNKLNEIQVPGYMFDTGSLTFHKIPSK